MRKRRRRGAKRGDRQLDRIRMYEHLKKQGKRGATNDEMEVDLEFFRQSSASARCRELVLRGLVYDSGKKRDTRTGFEAIVWRAFTEKTLSVPEDDRGRIVRPSVATLQAAVSNWGFGDGSPEEREVIRWLERIIRQAKRKERGKP